MKWCIPDIGQEEIDEVTDALREGWISGFGPKVKKFEKNVEQRLGVKHAIAVCNGTCGLIATFIAMKRLMGKENRDFGIALPTWTFIATATAADLIGEMWLTDVNVNTFNMDLTSFPQVILKSPLFIDILCPVDSSGTPVDYDRLLEYDKPIVADSCEAFGSTYNGRPLGSIADATVFSFHATKIITTGEGGMITTNRSDIANMVRSVVNMGYKQKGRYYEHSIAGYNFRMSDVNAAIGLVQLDHLDHYLEHRQRIVDIYKETLVEAPVTFQYIPPNVKPTNWVCTIMVCPKLRDGVVEALAKKEFPTRVWIPMHKQAPFSCYNGGQFKVADFLAESTINLPTHNMMTEEEALNIAITIKEYCKSKGVTK